MSTKQSSTEQSGCWHSARRYLSLLAVPMWSLLGSVLVSEVFLGFSLFQLLLFCAVAFPSLCLVTGIIWVYRVS